jgi:hypothetical protein
MAGTGNPLKSILNKATPPMAKLATTLGDGAWVTTGWRKTEDYRQKTDVAMWMTGREGGEMMVNNGSCPILVGTVGLSRTGKLFRTWRSPDSKSRPGTGNLPLAGNRTKTAVPITNTGTSAINNDRGTATPTSLVISTTITTTTAVIDRGNTRERSGKTRISSGENGNSRMTRTLTSLCFVHLLNLNVPLNL